LGGEVGKRGTKVETKGQDSKFIVGELSCAEVESCIKLVLRREGMGFEEL